MSVTASAAVLDIRDALEVALDRRVGLFAGRVKLAAFNDGAALVVKHETEQAIDIALFGGAGHLRIDFEDGFFDGGASGLGEASLLGSCKRGGAEGGVEYDDFHVSSFSDR